jgi:hypothetical protein
MACTTRHGGAPGREWVEVEEEEGSQNKKVSPMDVALAYTVCVIFPVFL